MGEKCYIMHYSWFYVENNLLLTIYKKAIEQHMEKDFIDFVFKEIKHRNLHPKDYFLQIK
ncbi:sporulation histidine kinase inhibitor Sda [Neobacillus endophyticus]|uniref:sporulation histidine kinase inhibitor Sda n=1 Tax=Neobacillus endophyticus TaxID=2738405 RepID=UPI0035E43632